MLTIINSLVCSLYALQGIVEPLVVLKEITLCESINLVLTAVTVPSLKLPQEEPGTRQTQHTECTATHQYSSVLN